MQRAALDATDGVLPNLFVFGSAYELISHDSAFEFEFQNAAGERVRLSD